MAYCDFQSDGDIYRCAGCNSTADRATIVRLCRPDNVLTVGMVKSINGPGTMLSRWLKSLGLTPCQRCLKTARKMNRMGPQWCEDNIEALADEINDNRLVHESILATLSQAVPAAAVRRAIKMAIGQAVIASRTAS